PVSTPLTTGRRSPLAATAASHPLRSKSIRSAPIGSRQPPVRVQSSSHLQPILHSLAFIRHRSPSTVVDLQPTFTAGT
ncbi:hypothetical protein LINPERHAP2_LOCUS9614, partial [Linum perenne]